MRSPMAISPGPWGLHGHGFIGLHGKPPTSMDSVAPPKKFFDTTEETRSHQSKKVLATAQEILPLHSRHVSVPSNKNLGAIWGSSCRLPGGVWGSFPGSFGTFPGLFPLTRGRPSHPHMGPSIPRVRSRPGPSIPGVCSVTGAVHPKDRPSQGPSLQGAFLFRGLLLPGGRPSQGSVLSRGPSIPGAIHPKGRPSKGPFSSGVRSCPGAVRP